MISTEYQPSTMPITVALKPKVNDLDAIESEISYRPVETTRKAKRAIRTAYDCVQVGLFEFELHQFHLRSAHFFFYEP